MAADTAVAATPEETLESLLREVEALKQKLEEERQKLNDVSCESRRSSRRFVTPSTLELTVISCVPQ